MSIRVLLETNWSMEMIQFIQAGFCFMHCWVALLLSLS